MVDDEALVPAVKVFMCVDPDSQLLQHGLIRSFTDCMHGGTDVIQNAHDTWRILAEQKGKIIQ